MTFRQMAILWDGGYLAKRDISTFVKENYKSILRNRIYPAIGEKELEDIQAEDLDELVVYLKQRAYSPKTIRNSLSVVRSIILYALKKGYIRQNPLDRMDDLPSVKKKNTIHFFTIKECRVFLEALDNYPLGTKTFFTIMVYSGFRRSELCALNWDNIDYEKGQITINKALSQTKEGLIVKPPKTISSERTICLPSICFDLLKQMEKEKSSNFVFTRVNKKDPIWPQHQSRKFHQIIENYNHAHENKLPNIRLHDLRHTAATILIAQGVDVETVARRLGHSNPSMTLNIYAHPTLEADKKASHLLANLLNEEKDLS